MIQNVLRHIGGIQGYGMVALVLFFVVFSGVLVWAMAQRKSHMELMARLPLEDEQKPNGRFSHE